MDERGTALVCAFVEVKGASFQNVCSHDDALMANSGELAKPHNDTDYSSCYTQQKIAGRGNNNSNNDSAVSREVP